MIGNWRYLIETRRVQIAHQGHSYRVPVGATVSHRHREWDITALHDRSNPDPTRDVWVAATFDVQRQVFICPDCGAIITAEAIALYPTEVS